MSVSLASSKSAERVTRLYLEGRVGEDLVWRRALGLSLKVPFAGDCTGGAYISDSCDICVGDDNAANKGRTLSHCCCVVVSDECNAIRKGDEGECGGATAVKYMLLSSPSKSSIVSLTTLSQTFAAALSASRASIA